MANTQITDIIGANGDKVLGPLVNALIPAKNALINSGIAVRAPEFDSIISGGSRKASVPYIKPLDPTQVNIGNDDLTDLGDIGKLVADEYTAHRVDLNYGFGVADLVQMVTLYNAKGGIQAGLAQYWNSVFQKRAVSTLKGIKAAESTLTSGSASTALSFGAIVDAAATAGENMDMFNTLVVHSTTYANILKAYKPVLDPTTGLLTVGGYRLIIDNGLGNGVTALVRTGALAFAVGQPAGVVPFEVERVANGGNGQGGDVLHSRQSVLIHPQGFNYKGAVASTTTVLETAASWEMALDLDQVGIRFIAHSTDAIDAASHVVVDNAAEFPTAA